MFEHWRGELERKLLGALERRGLGAREVGHPVHEVEGDVGGGGVAGLEHRLEFREEGTGRRLGLHGAASGAAKGG